MARYIDFMDMIDGGGAGKMGGKFEGGGLLSVLANAFATPYGAEDEERRKRLMQSRGLLDMSAPPAPVQRTYSGRGDAGMPIPAPKLDASGGAGPNIPNATPSFDAGSIDAFGGIGPMRYSGRGNAEGSGYVPLRPVKDMDTLLEWYLIGKSFKDSSRLEDRMKELFGFNVSRDVQSRVAAMPSDPMFVEFIEQQRRLEQKYGLERKSLADIEDMYHLQKKRGRF